MLAMTACNTMTSAQRAERDALVAQAVDKALELRPDLQSDKMVVHVQEESLKAIKRQYAPAISASLTWAYNKDEHSYSSPLQVGAGIDLGSINPYGIHYQIKEGENMLNIAKHNVNIAKSSIYWEVQDNYINKNYNQAQLNFVESVLKYNIARETLMKSMGMGLNKDGNLSTEL